MRAYKRAKRAITAGYYLEAVTLCESLILNRLEVVLASSGGIEYSKFSVGKALNTLESHKIPVFDETLLDDSKDWVGVRNSFSHHFAKVDLPEFPSWRTRIAAAGELARSGLELANRWSKESRKHKI